MFQRGSWCNPAGMPPGPVSTFPQDRLCNPVHLGRGSSRGPGLRTKLRISMFGRRQTLEVERTHSASPSKERRVRGELGEGARRGGATPGTLMDGLRSGGATPGTLMGGLRSGGATPGTLMGGLRVGVLPARFRRASLWTSAPFRSSPRTPREQGSRSG